MQVCQGTLHRIQFTLIYCWYRFSRTHIVSHEIIKLYLHQYWRFIVSIQNFTIWNVRWCVPSGKLFSQNYSSRRRWIHVWIPRKTLREDRTAICVHYEFQAKTEESPSQGTRTWRICLNHNNSINYLREPYLRHNNRLYVASRCAFVIV